jgi:hypothetical protein
MFVVNEVVKSVNDATQFLCYKNYFSIFKKKNYKKKKEYWGIMEIAKLKLSHLRFILRQLISL